MRIRLALTFAMAALLAACGAAFDASDDAGAGGSGASGGEPSTGGAGAGSSGGAGGAGGQSPTQWADTDHGFRKSITIAELGVSADVKDVVVPVLFEADADIAAAARGDGRDLMFTADDAVTPIPHELELYDAGRVVAWVRVPELKAFGDSRIYLYYGEDAGEPWGDAAATWQDVATSVWHMGDELSGAAKLTDSASSNHGTPPGTVETPTLAAGIAGNALAFDGDDTVRVNDPADGSLDFGTRSFSFSLWLLKGALDSGSCVIFRKSGTCTGCRGWAIVAGSINWRASFDDGGTFGPNIPFGAASLFVDTWTHLAVVVDREADEIRVYANGSPGAETASLADAGGFSNADRIDMGLPLGWPLLGSMDEVRVYPHAAPQDWFIIEHAILKDPSLLTRGPQQTAPEP